MKFGIFFSMQHPRPWLEGGEQALYDQSLEQVEIADRIGIQYCWGQEHNFLEEYSHSSAPEVYLAAFTQRTERIRIGHGIVHMPPGMNHPARVAERLATLDLLSHGRVEWGTGEAGTRIELEAFGIPYVEKRAMWEEATREVAKMLCSDPYAGFEGRHFSFPPRNIVPKPVQQPHPPIWVACTNRATLRHAARHGIGALTFAFMNAREARFWVEEYYDVFARECRPIGRCVNPNVAMLSQFMCHEDERVAIERGAAGAHFFAFGLSHYFRTGSHVPGREDIWRKFQESPPFPMAGNLGLGTPAQIRENFEAFEEAGVDQLILLHQAGGYVHDHIMDSLALFGREVLPDFIDRDLKAEAEKLGRLEPAIARALAHVPPLAVPSDLKPVPCYMQTLRDMGASESQLNRDREPHAAIWRLQVGGPRKKSGRRN